MIREWEDKIDVEQYYRRTPEVLSHLKDPITVINAQIQPINSLMKEIN